MRQQFDVGLNFCPISRHKWLKLIGALLQCSIVSYHIKLQYLLIEHIERKP